MNGNDDYRLKGDQNATMVKPQFTPADFVELRVVEPCDDCNLYSYDPQGEGLRLSGVYRTNQSAPVDQATVPETSPDGKSDLSVLLVSHRATFPGCLVTARPIALLEMRTGARQEYQIVAVPAVDEMALAIFTIEDLTEEQRHAIVNYARSRINGQGSGDWRWSDAAHARQVIHQAKQAARVVQAKAHKHTSAAPAWKPLGYHVSGARRASDTEPNTKAEYAYHQLPIRFQKYVDDYLVQTERILFAVNRPAMKSEFRRSWHSDGILQAGILFITDQQVVLVTEIIPPDQSKIRYGYVVQTGIPERIKAVDVKQVGANACIEVTWCASGGEQRVTWEFPIEASGELNQAADLLQRWQPVANERRLRRAYGPEPIDAELSDPAASDPADIVPVVNRLTDVLTATLTPTERVLARALLPGWADSHKVTHLFVVTHRRALLLPDPHGNHRLKPSFYPLERISSAECKSSILNSWVALNITDKGMVHRTEIRFPCTASSFQTCFTVLRQQLVAIPV